MVYKYIVVDSGIIIKGDSANLHKLGTNVVTIQEVLNEIKDEKSRTLLTNLPYEIVIMTPSTESMNFVIQFSRKTGDLAVLSVTDLKLMALAHTLEVQVNRESIARSEKILSTTSEEVLLLSETTATVVDLPEENTITEADMTIEPTSNDLSTTIDQSDALDIESVMIQDFEIEPVTDANTIHECTCTSSTTAEVPTTISRASTAAVSVVKSSDKTPILSRILNRTDNGSSAQVDDDGENWISKDNLHNQGLNNIKVSKAKSKKIQVTCMTTDFAMQNVLMQMGLHIASIDGSIIRSVKQWVLRCNGCYNIHYDMDRLFCIKCGLNYLSKVGCHIDASNGELKLHLKKNFHHNVRGTKYSLPTPDKSDRFDGGLLLREDQLLSGIWRQKSHTIRKNILSAFGDEITHDVGISVNKGLRVSVGYGAKNPNAQKGRERRGKAKSK